MVDKRAISERFFLCYRNESRRSLAKLLGVQQPTVTEWASDGRVPWNKLKYLSDSQAISWDWLIDGMEPKGSLKKVITSRSAQPKFNRTEINRRFLSLFPGMSQTQIAATLDITPGAVHEWHKNKSQVPWERLHDAVKSFGVRWDWLIDGLEPKYREQEPRQLFVGEERGTQ